MHEALTLDQLAALKQLDTCTVANAIETFNVRLRNEGYTDTSIRSIFPHLRPMVGYAATVRIRCSNPPPVQGRMYPERTDWWNYVLSVPAPRVVVIEDVDENRGAGAFLGEVHAHILRALQCVGVVTNGTVRDVPAIEAAGLPLFAGAVAVSHAYVHIVDFGEPVEVGGLSIAPGDLLHGDCHGVLSVPKEIAAEIPAAAARLVEREKKAIAICRSSEFSLQKLRTAVEGIFD
jgi:regulator of RNase E activity RraA